MMRFKDFLRETWQDDEAPHIRPHGLKPGTRVRTRKSGVVGTAEKVVPQHATNSWTADAVFFRTDDGKRMVTPIYNVTVLEGWMPHPDGTYSAERSDIDDYVKHDRFNVRCPKCRERLNPKVFEKHVDQEGDITHWTYKHSCGAPITVFNDHYELKGKQLDEGKTKTKRAFRPRAKHLSKVMAGRKGGSHYNARTDYVRAKEKQKAHKEMNEAVAPDDKPNPMDV
jgi:hypothetical protein